MPYRDKTITERVYDYMESFKDAHITVEEVRIKLGLKYNTAIGIMFRLNREGRITRIKKGVYKFKG